MGRQDTGALQALIERLTTFKVLNWSSSSSDKDTDREPAPLEEANVVASRYKNDTRRHALLLDIDHPTWLVKSTTPGHFHLYVDVPDGIPHEHYMVLLRALAGAGVIEPGYASASQSRGHSDLRLPWIKKESA